MDLDFLANAFSLLSEKETSMDEWHSFLLLLIILEKDKQGQEKHGFLSDSWRVLCSTFHPGHPHSTAFHFYMPVSVNTPTLQSCKIIHVYVTQRCCFQSYANRSYSLSILWLSICYQGRITLACSKNLCLLS